LQELARKLPMALAALLQPLQTLSLQMILQVAEASLELFQSGGAILHGLLLLLDPTLESWETHQWLGID
jgi:hypothetical protein